MGPDFGGREGKREVVAISEGEKERRGELGVR